MLIGSFRRRMVHVAADLPDDLPHIPGIDGALRFDQKAHGLAPDMQIDAGVVAAITPGRRLPQTELGVRLWQTAVGLQNAFDQVSLSVHGCDRRFFTAQ